MKQHLLAGFSLVCLVTTALFILTYLVIGCYYETNDDVILTFLIKGVFNGQPISNLTLYLHGLSAMIAGLYQILPAVPWYGVVLYSLLLGVTLLAFWLIYKRFQNVLTPARVILLLVFLYLANWYEHVFWFNYSRLPILLAGTAGIWAWLNEQSVNDATLKHALIHGVLFFLALCVRPSLAVFGLTLVLPLLFLPLRATFTLKQGVTRLLPFVLAGVVFSAAVLLPETAAQKQYRHYDVLKSQVLDYNLCCPTPTTEAAKWQYAGINQWFLADSSILQFLDQHAVDWTFFWQNAAYFKLVQLLRYLLLDQFVALSVVFTFFIWFVKRSSKKKILLFAGYHLYFWSILVFTGIFLKIPPRILTPAMSVYLLSHLLWLPASVQIAPWKKWPLSLKLIGFILLAVQLYKIQHRSAWQQQRQNQSEVVWAQVKHHYPGYLVLTAGLENELRALSPFKNYSLGNQQILFLTSWQTLDPNYARNWQTLTGQTSLGQALIRLSQQDKVVWVCNPEFIAFLENYIRVFYRQTLAYTFVRPLSRPKSPEKLGYYTVKIKSD